MANGVPQKSGLFNSNTLGGHSHFFSSTQTSRSNPGGLLFSCRLDRQFRES